MLTRISFFSACLLCFSLLHLCPAPLHAQGQAQKETPVQASKKTADPAVQLATGQTSQQSPQHIPPAEAAAKPNSETRELWTGSLYSSTYSAGVCLAQDGTLRGVLLLRTPAGKVDVYHFRGEHDGGQDGKGSTVSARHSSGHAFRGTLDDKDEISGTITLKSGFNITLKGQRTHHVELTETCRPLEPPAAPSK